MRVVVDTNVLISGIFFSGPPAQILSFWRSGKFTIVISKSIISEYTRVAEAISTKFPLIDISKILELIVMHSDIVDIGKFEVTACEDPDDNKFLECAIMGNCDIIISGDKHLLKLNDFQGVKIVTPREFLDNFLI